jgi:hypothetical protein
MKDIGEQHHVVVCSQVGIPQVARTEFHDIGNLLGIS